MKRRFIFASLFLILILFFIVITNFGFETERKTQSLDKEGLPNIKGNVKIYDEKTQTIKLKNNKGKDLAEIQLLTPLSNNVGVGYVRIAEYKVSGKTNLNKGFFGEILSYDKNKFDKGEEVEIGKVFDLKYKLIEEVMTDDYNCTLRTLKNGTMDNICEVIGQSMKEKISWLEFDKNTKVKKDEEITIGLYTNTEEGEYVEWIPYFANVKVPEFASWTSALNTSIISAYKHDEGAGASGTIIDSHGSNDGTNNGASNSSGKINSAYDFDGSDYINTNINQNYDVLSANVWVYRDNLRPVGTFESLLVRDKAGSRSFGLFTVNDGGVLKPYLEIGGTILCGGGTPSNQSFGAGEWAMVSFAYDESTQKGKVWLNGELALERTVSLNFGSYSTSIWEGRREYAPYYNNADGKIDEPYFWERVITQSEVDLLWDNGDGLQYGQADAPTDSCTCPSLNTNWEIDLSDYCVIDSNCDIGTGNITWTSTGNITFNATVEALGIAGLPDNQKGWLGINAEVLQG